MGLEIMSRIHEMDNLAFSFVSTDGFGGNIRWKLSEINIDYDQINLYSNENMFYILIEDIDSFYEDEENLTIKMKKGGDILFSPI